jgi:hypothetical protein
MGCVGNVPLQLSHVNLRSREGRTGFADPGRAGARRTLAAVSDPFPGEDPLTCSARGCRASAVWALRWNNPRLHPPERRKVWLACAEHRRSLADFLDARGFLREVVAAGRSPTLDA